MACLLLKRFCELNYTLSVCMSPYANDKTLRESLYMLLLQRPADEILEEWKEEFYGMPSGHKDCTQKMSHLLSKMQPDRFSENDAQQLVAGLREQYFLKGHCGIFECILDFAEQTLTLKSGTPEIKFDEILRWRDTTHQIGTVPFLAAYLAYEDQIVGRSRIDFALNPILSTDNRKLKQILSKGMAENHFHLNGSAPSFMISWIRLMNNPVFDAREWLEFNELQGESGRQGLPDWKTLIYKAAVIRALLFCLLTESEPHNQVGLEMNYPSELIVSFLDILFDRILPEQSETDFLAVLKALYKCWQPGSFGNNWGIHDYSFTLPNRIPLQEELAYMIFAGEIRWQYIVFKSIFQKNPKIQPYIKLFYAYLAIQSQFRSEFIENDHRFGLENFCRYDHRKKSFFENRDRKIQKIIPALEHLTDKRVVSLEVRIVPDNDECSLKKQIMDIDFMICNALENANVNAEEIHRMIQRMHYVLHFVKKRDKVSYSGGYSLRYRHQEIRENLKKTADGIISLRENDRAIASRITGIDGCSNEIYTRPEVFAAEFRRLKNHTPITSCAWRPLLQPLYVTYHVGEDFLDVADGLRAVWEAITFLEMERTSRIGHGLALGIDIEEWYAKKQYRVYLSRQAVLDNCTWLLKFLDINGELESALRFELLGYIETMYAQIYQNGEAEPFFLDCYWNAMQLRGDDPIVYREIEPWDQFLHALDIQAVIDPYALRDNHSSSVLNSIRRCHPSAVRLYHRYHYDPNVRQCGEKSIEFHVTLSMIHGMMKAQTMLRNYVAQKGIGIETNPSSNVLIGNFNRYEKHPIFSFNDNGLFDKADTPNISVSINTDDQGIFDTSLENEYALLARSLEQMHDKNGNPVVDQDHIYGWLDHVREMGISQSFHQMS